MLLFQKGLLMNRHGYLSNPYISEFSEYLTTIFDNAKFQHSWVSYDKKSTGITRGDRWYCNDLKDAIVNYYWPSTNPETGHRFNSLQETESLLGDYSVRLKQSLELNSIEAARDVVYKILKWGGVADRKHVAAKFKDPQFDLLSYLLKVSKTCQLDAVDLSDFGNDKEKWLIVDSGTTKVFSLLIPGFAMLDSRVGCALGIIASRYWQSTGRPIHALPEILRFMWGGEDNRNPNPNAQGIAVFRKLSNDGNVRAIQNFQVSWLLGDVAEKLQSHNFFIGKQVSQIVRELEAGLFVVGYGVEQSSRPLASAPNNKTATARISLFSKGRTIFIDGVSKGLSRKQIISRFEDELNFKSTTASSYYQQYKKSEAE